MKFSYILAFVSFFVLTASPALAVTSTTATPTTTPKTNTTPTSTKAPTGLKASADDTTTETARAAVESALTAYKAAKAEEQLAKIQALGDKLITFREQELARVRTTVTANKNLTDSQKSTLLTIIDQNNSSLVTYASQLKAAKTVDEAKAIIKSAYQLRIFASVLPQIHGLTVADRLSDISSKLESLSVQIDSQLAALKQKGASTAELDNAYATYKTALLSLKQNMTTATNSLSTLPTDPAAAESAKATGVAALKAAQKDAASIRTLLPAIMKSIALLNNLPDPTATTGTTSPTIQK